MIAFFIGFLLIVGMVFLMLKSPDFASAVGIVIAMMLFVMLLGVALASCS
jgi:hypothetical protein